MRGCAAVRRLCACGVAVRMRVRAVGRELGRSRVRGSAGRARRGEEQDHVSGHVSDEAMAPVTPPPTSIEDVATRSWIPVPKFLTSVRFFDAG